MQGWRDLSARYNYYMRLRLLKRIFSVFFNYPMMKNLKDFQCFRCSMLVASNKMSIWFLKKIIFQSQLNEKIKNHKNNLNQMQKAR